MLLSPHERSSAGSAPGVPAIRESGRAGRMGTPPCGRGQESAEGYM